MELSNKRKIFVGNLPPRITGKEIERKFATFGKVVFVDYRESLGKRFGFVYFYDEKGVEAAVNSPDGVYLRGWKLRVENTKSGGEGGGAPARKRYGTSLDSTPREGHWIKISGLPRTANWNDVKAFVRGKGYSAKFVAMISEGVAKVELPTYESMREAIRGLDLVTMVQSGQSGCLQVTEVTEDEGRRQARSRSRSRSPIKRHR